MADRAVIFGQETSDAAQIHPFPSLKVIGTQNPYTPHIKLGEGKVSGQNSQV